jgi:hypothetical protein
MAGPLGVHVLPGATAQLFINEGHEPVECRLVSVFPGNQQFGNIVR